eukprot:NODE_9886_length_1393_cov_1.758294.p1 GENE.NODE_9886_length_1393_cov_1.758294~~NODE_9886_length_1393_cov_1.758294.p1  ORF type:complete len:256 (+),score=60.41 NODE_9886_length_1393_cov_1.758294:238-1005(+)
MRVWRHAIHACAADALMPPIALSHRHFAARYAPRYVALGAWAPRTWQNAGAHLRAAAHTSRTATAAAWGEHNAANAGWRHAAAMMTCAVAAESVGVWRAGFAGGYTQLDAAKTSWAATQAFTRRPLPTRLLGGPARRVDGGLLPTEVVRATRRPAVAKLGGGVRGAARAGHTPAPCGALGPLHCALVAQGMPVRVQASAPVQCDLPHEARRGVRSHTISHPGSLARHGMPSGTSSAHAALVSRCHADGFIRLANN